MRNEHLSRRVFLTTTATVASTGLVRPDSESSSERRPSSPGGTAPVSGGGRRLGGLEPGTFLNPGTEYRGVPFFFLNDKIDGAEAVRQVRGMRYAGWGRVLPRRYSGLLDATYGRRWNEVIHQIIEASKQLGMKVFLQEADKNGWYSAAPTQIPGMKDEYRNKCLVRRPTNEKPGEHEILITRTDDYAYYQRSAYPRPGWEHSFCWLDLLDEDVVRSYLTALFGFLHREFGNEFGRAIEAVWVAEPHVMMGEPADVPSVPWTTKLPAVFEKHWGYSLIDNVAKLFEQQDDYQKVRYNFWRTVGDRMAECYARVMGEYCHRYNLKFTGHLMGEDTFSSQLQYSVNVMPLMEYMDIPAIDHLTMDLYWPTGDPFIFTPKQVSSVANQLGKREVLAEMYGVSDLGCSFEDRKRVFEWLAALGINYRNYHGSFYSLRGHRKRVYPPNFNLQQPYWDENRVIADYCARLSYALRQGRYAADVLIVNSIESGYLEGRRGPKMVGSLDQDLFDLSHNLLKIQRGFDYGDETLIGKYGKVANGKFVVGEMSYRLVVLPEIRTLRSSTVKLLAEFLDAGGAIVSVGSLPTRIDGERSEQITLVNKRVVRTRNDPRALRKILDRLAPPDVRLRLLNGASTGPIWVNQKILDEGELFFLVNTSSDTTVRAEVLLKGNGRVENWSLESGKVECLQQRKEGEYVATTLEFVPGGSYLLHMSTDAPPISAPVRSWKAIREIPLSSFQVRRHEPNAMTLDFCRFQRGEGDWSEILPVQGVQEILADTRYSGPVMLRFEFESEIRPSRCAVVIEEADKFAIRVNNRSVERERQAGPFYRDRCFLPVDITDHLQIGTNFVDVTGHFEAADKKHIDNENLYKFYGTELEQVYLIGEFAVRGERIGSDFFETERHRYAPRFVIAQESGVSAGDLLADGYPFFNGRISLTAHAVIPEIRQDERYFVELGRLGATVADIKVNRRDLGKIAWHPYRIEITEFVWDGENLIELSLTNSLRNLLGGLHFVPLKDGHRGQWSLKANPRSVDGSQWYRNREKDKTWSDDYFFRPLGPGKAKIVCEKCS